MNDDAPVSPKPLGEELALGYIETLGDQQRRAATFYEYARHSDAIKDLVERLRNEGYFSGKPGSKELQDLLISKTISGVLKVDALLMLVECDSFPKMPFNASARYRELFASTTQSFGIDPPRFLPWHAVDELRADWRKKGLDESEMLKRADWHVVHIPWKDYTNEEIIEMLDERVRKLRPKHVPGPQKSGRRGRTKSLGTLDMVHQLAAYRLHAAGYDYSKGGPLCATTKGEALYTTVEGWRKAIRAAEHRIGGMITRPFFGAQ